MKTKTFSLVATLRIFCAIGEVVTCLGLIAMAISIPFSESLVNGHHANIGIFVVNGSPNWMYYGRLPHSRTGSISYRSPALSPEPDGMPTPNSALGDISVGPFQMSIDEDAQRAISQGIKTQAATIDHFQGTVTFKHPENAAQILAPIKWPFVISMLVMGSAGVAVLDLLRRMLQSVGRGEVFSAANIKHVRTIGFLLVASSILKFIAVGWLMSGMAATVTQHVAGRTTFASTYEGNLSGLGTGLVILALAEVFRQGLKLKEDAQLTI